MNHRPLSLALSAVALATAAMGGSQALAHGGGARMVPLKVAAKDVKAMLKKSLLPV